MLLSEFHVQRRDFWYHWTYNAIASVICMRIERQPDPDKGNKPPAQTYSPTSDFDKLFSE